MWGRDMWIMTLKRGVCECWASLMRGMFYDRVVFSVFRLYIAFSAATNHVFVSFDLNESS